MVRVVTPRDWDYAIPAGMLQFGDDGYPRPLKPRILATRWKGLNRFCRKQLKMWMREPCRVTSAPNHVRLV